MTGQISHSVQGVGKKGTELKPNQSIEIRREPLRGIRNEGKRAHKGRVREGGGGGGFKRGKSLKRIRYVWGGGGEPLGVRKGKGGLQFSKEGRGLSVVQRGS